MHARTFVKGAAIGAAAVYLFDPISGRGRRARLRDHALALTRRTRERADDLSMHAANVVGGKIREAVAPLRSRATDDATVADRVRSEVLGRRDLGASGVVVDVEDGVVHLRGQLQDQARIDRLVDLTRDVAGVRVVENLLHLPGQAAPNKQAARATGDGSR